MPNYCITKDCKSTRNQGLFIGDLCSPCYAFVAYGSETNCQVFRNAVIKLTQKPEGRRTERESASFNLKVIEEQLKLGGPWKTFVFEKEDEMNPGTCEICGNKGVHVIWVKISGENYGMHCAACLHKLTERLHMRPPPWKSILKGFIGGFVLAQIFIWLIKYFGYQFGGAP